MFSAMQIFTTIIIVGFAFLFSIMFRYLVEIPICSASFSCEILLRNLSILMLSAITSNISLSIKYKKNI